MKAISLDLRERIPAAYDADEGAREEVPAVSGSLDMVGKLLQQCRRLGDIRRRELQAPGPAGSGGIAWACPCLRLTAA